MCGSLPRSQEAGLPLREPRRPVTARESRRGSSLPCAAGAVILCPQPPGSGCHRPAFSRPALIQTAGENHMMGVRTV